MTLPWIGCRMSLLATMDGGTAPHDTTTVEIIAATTPYSLPRSRSGVQEGKSNSLGATIVVLHREPRSHRSRHPSIRDAWDASILNQGVAPRTQRKPIECQRVDGRLGGRCVAMMDVFCE